MDESAKNEIYVTYKPKVSAFMHGKINNYYDAEDLVSSVFVKVYAKIDTFDETKASISTWIYHIAQNTVIDFFRAKGVQQKFIDEGEMQEDIPATEEEADEQLEMLADALESLNERERSLIILHYYKKKSLKEVALIMGMSYSNIKIIHSKALSHLRDFYPN